jgi:DNA-binding GntR family transcriptional regulator
MEPKNIKISQEIAEQLRDAIVSGEYKPRERLIEMELSRRYNVSRTPIREAIKELESAGLVKVEPYHGAAVSDIDIDEIRSIYEVRSVLEGFAAFLATPNVTPEILDKMRESLKNMENYAKRDEKTCFGEENERFHRLIYGNCGNQVMINIIEDLLKRTMAFRRMSWHSPRNLKVATKGHRDIYNAIESGDAAKAQALSIHHIRLYLTDKLIAK